MASNVSMMKRLILIGSLLVCLLGAVLSSQLENALLPAIDRPEISISMQWPGKSTDEIEQTLVAPLEYVLANLNNKTLMHAQVQSGQATIRLEFKSNTDMEQAYQDTLTLVNQVPGWPADVAAPRVQNLANGSNATLATAMLYSTQPVSRSEYINTFETYIKPKLSHIAGIANINTNINSIEQRIEIEVDHDKLKHYGISVEWLQRQLQNLVDNSGDRLEIGNRHYSLHFKGQLELDELRNLPVYYQSHLTLYLKDIARITKRVEQDWMFSSIHGHRAFYMSFEPSVNVNLMATLEQINIVFKELNTGSLSPLNMQITLSRDDSKAVKSAISQVYTALALGIFLSSMILFYFLRKLPPVILIFSTIPVCLSIVVVAMYFFGYSLNVISLAGMALSIGLLLDSAIVVIESIQQERQKGLPLNKAIVQGVVTVKAAICSSTISSIIIFVPILLMHGPEAQLFSDLAFTLSSALLASLLTALFLLPILARFILRRSNVEQSQPKSPSNWFNSISNKRIYTYTILILCLPFAIFLTYILTPSMDVLPSPKNRSVLAYITFSDPLPPNAVEKNIATPVFERLEQQKSDPNSQGYDVTGMFCFPGLCLLYFYPPEEWDYDTFSAWVKTEITQDIPGTRVFVQHANLLQFALPNSGITQLDIQGDKLDVLQHAGQSLLTELQSVFADARITAEGELENRTARIEFTPNYHALLRHGIDKQALNTYLQTLTQGVFLGRFSSQGESLPYYLKTETAQDLEQLMNTLVKFPNTGLLPLHELTTAELVLAPSSISKINSKTVVTLNLEPPENMALSEFIPRVKSHISSLASTPEYEELTLSFRGSADRLDDFINQFSKMFALSLVILCFLLRLSIKDWKQTFAVLLSTPLAMAGSMIGLFFLNKFTAQKLDVITLIGFIILLGLVINNAILLVNKFQQGLDRGLTQGEAIELAIATRKRPIFMSTGTSIFGMLPLMLLPGEGAEIYRGLATVIIAGMTFSALFTLSFMAALLSLSWFAPKAVEIRLQQAA